MQEMCHIRNLETLLYWPEWRQAIGWIALKVVPVKCKLTSATIILVSCNPCTHAIIYTQNIMPCVNTKPSVACSSALMNRCWNEDRELRPTFHEIRIEFDHFISDNEMDNYLLVSSTPDEMGEAKLQD